MSDIGRRSVRRQLKRRFPMRRGRMVEVGAEGRCTRPSALPTWSLELRCGYDFLKFVGFDFRRCQTAAGKRAFECSSLRRLCIRTMSPLRSWADAEFGFLRYRLFASGRSSSECHFSRLSGLFRFVVNSSGEIVIAGDCFIAGTRACYFSEGVACRERVRAHPNHACKHECGQACYLSLTASEGSLAFTHKHFGPPFGIVVDTRRVSFAGASTVR